MNLTSKRMLQFMTVCAGACALSATATTATTNWVADSFEGTAGTTNLLANRYKMIVTGLNDQDTNNLWSVVAGDESKLVGGDASESGYTGIRPIPSTDQKLYLSLATGTLPISRKVNEDGSALSLTTAPTIYVDTLIKFTPMSDEAAPTIDPIVKIAVYVNVNSNLVVYHGDSAGGGGITNSVIPGIISPANWNRLTIKMDMPEGFVKPLCQIYTNGGLITHVNAVTDVNVPGGTRFYIVGTDNTLTNVQFRGTGAVDELVVSDGIDLGESMAVLLTLSFNDTMVAVTKDGGAITNHGTVATGSTIAISAKPWYEITNPGALFTGTTTNYYGATAMITNIVGTVTDANGTTNTITAATYSDTGSISTGLGGSYPANKVAAWATDPAKGNNASPLTTDMADEYLLNAALNTNPKLQINSISYNGTIATITVGVTNAPGVVDFGTINGSMGVKTRASLSSGSFGTPAEGVAVTGTTTSNKTVTVTTAAGPFIQAVVQ